MNRNILGIRPSIEIERRKHERLAELDETRNKIPGDAALFDAAFAVSVATIVGNEQWKVIVGLAMKYHEETRKSHAAL